MTSPHGSNTVFLAKQEVERIRSTVKNRSKKCSELAGHAREPRDLEAAVRQATGASLMADMGAPDIDSTQTRGRAGTLPVLAVGQPYPPCVISCQHLQPMKIADLQIDTHHRGRRLIVKRMSPVATLAARSWTMVGDEDGETERLEVCLHKSRHGRDVLESASSFVIKEPYFTLTDQGEATIRVDHPSDLIVYREEIANSRPTFGTEANGQTQDTIEAGKFARICKDKGNIALEQQNLPLAHAFYTEGIKAARQTVVSEADPNLLQDIRRNRAHVNLLLNQLEEAKLDAKAALTGQEDQRSKDLDSKAYFRAGCAAYDLGEYKEADGFFERQQDLTPGIKNAGIYRRNIQRRLREVETGSYDFKKVKAGLSRSRPRVDAASFLRNTEIRDSPGRGRGLFATRVILDGEIVICEKAFCVVWGYEKEALTAITYDLRDDRIRVSPVGLDKSIVQKLLRNSSQIKMIMNLYGDYQANENNVFATEDGPVVDSFQVHDIVSRNAFGPGSQYGEEGERSASTGLWVHAAYVNHSCIANVEKEYIGDLMVLRACRPINAGEEIFHSYDESSHYEARQAALMATWGFKCDCALCVAEKTDDAALQKKRRELADEADAFVERENWANAKRLTITKARRLEKMIEDTYNNGKKYKGLPRLATKRIHEWLALASR
ncbi:hypothetical protein F4804DRAFT_306049 [Jackrogersella minutella]|nr:hypothetical protein F4804DRAFT_306049 [Jackrogersella minutella]